VNTSTGRPGRLPFVGVAVTMFGVGWGANQFVSLLVGSHLHRHVSVGTDQALFGIYALGLMPSLLVAGPASDRWGRARVIRPLAVVSVVATLVLIGGDHHVAALYVGRFLGRPAPVAPRSRCRRASGSARWRPA
jgi:MFS family permease